MCRKIYKMATELEKYKLLEQRKLYLEAEKQKRDTERLKLERIETVYQGHIKQLRERIEQERFRMAVSKYA